MRPLRHLTMVASVAFTAAALVAACGVLSGLDSLDVEDCPTCDGGTDGGAGDGGAGDVVTGDAAGAGDAMTPPGQDSGGGGDASGPDASGPDATPSGAIACGTGSCDIGQACCVRPSMGTRSCAGNCNPSKDLAFECDTPDDCTNGNVCCAQAGFPTGSKIECASPCPGVILCNLDGGMCANGVPCAPSPVSGYGACP